MRKASLEDTVQVGVGNGKRSLQQTPPRREMIFVCHPGFTVCDACVGRGPLGARLSFSVLLAESSAPLCPAQCIINEETSLPVFGQLICSYNHDFKYHMNNSENYFTVVR